MTTTPSIARSLLLFVLAGIMEIGGGYLIWLWLREGGCSFSAPWADSSSSFIASCLHCSPRNSVESMLRTEACSWCSILWGWWIHGRAPDHADLAGAALCVIGVAVIMYGRRATGLRWN